MSTRYAQWGRSSIHLADLVEQRTVCGCEVPDGARTIIYPPVLCTRCKAKATDAQKADAEEHRLSLFNQFKDHQEGQLGANRRGEFVVYRCRLCGRQHRGPTSGPGVPFCEAAGHVADLEQITVQGPAFAGAVASQGPRVR